MNSPGQKQWMTVTINGNIAATALVTVKIDMQGRPVVERVDNLEWVPGYEGLATALEMPDYSHLSIAGAHPDPPPYPEEHHWEVGREGVLHHATLVTEIPSKPGRDLSDTMTPLKLTSGPDGGWTHAALTRAGLERKMQRTERRLGIDHAPRSDVDPRDPGQPERRG